MWCTTQQDYGDQKISLRNKKKSMILTNGDVYKETTSGQRKKGMTMVTASETEKLVAFAKKNEEAGVAVCKHCGLAQKGRCTKQENVQTSLDRFAPLLQKINICKTDTDKTVTLDGLLQMDASGTVRSHASTSAGQVCHTPYTATGPMHRPPLGRGKGDAGGAWLGGGCSSNARYRRRLAIADRVMDVSIECADVMHDKK